MKHPPAVLAGCAAALVIAGFHLLLYGALAPHRLDVAMCQWDCNWYLSVARDGYDPATRDIAGRPQANWAFFPLYPVLLGSVVAVTGARPELAGLLSSTACFVVFAVLAQAYRRRTRPAAAAPGWFWLLAAWPFVFYFHAPYSEPLFAVLATAALWAMANGRAFVAGGAVALLTATRPTGILLAIGLGVRQLGRIARGERPVMRHLLPALIGGLGLLAFMALLAVRTGNPIAFLSIQGAWGRQASNPLDLLAGGFGDFALARHHVGRAYESGWACLGLLAAAWLAANRRLMEAWLCGGVVIMGLVAGGVGSMPRYVATNPAFLFATADLLDRVRYRRLHTALLIAMMAIQIGFVLAWFRGANFLT